MTADLVILVFFLVHVLRIDRSINWICRFWHSTAAYAFAQYVSDNPDKEIPAEGDKIYNWPEDLLKPDVIAYLCVNEQKRLERIRGRPELTDQEHLLQNKQKFRLE